MTGPELPPPDAADGDLGCDRRLVGRAPERIAVWSWGAGPQVLVFLHALLAGSSGRSVAETAALLTRDLPVTVLGVDGPGFGDSDPLPAAEYDLDRLAARLHRAVAQVTPGPYVVMGHSWGAALAVRLAATRPQDVRGLVLLDGGHFDHADLLDHGDTDLPVSATAAEMEAVGWRHEPAPLEEVLDGYRPFDGRARDLLPHVVRSGLSPAAGSPGLWESRVRVPSAAAAMHALMRSRTSPHYAALAAHDTPVLLLTATEPAERRRDNAERVARLRHHLPLATVVAVPASRHDLFLDAPEVVADAVRDWWPSTPAGLSPGRGSPST